jgi:hypothetical protein
MPILGCSYLAAWLATGVLGAEPVPTAAPSLAFEEKLLREAGVTPDGPGLVAFFRSRVLTPDHQEKLRNAVRQLGSDEFDVRERAAQELVQAGRASLAWLKPAQQDTDPEVARRAQRCVEEIEQTPYASILSAAAQVAAVRPAPGLCEALLGCLPWVDDEPAQEILFQTLATVGRKADGVDPAVLAAAGDKEPLRRAGAAYVLGQAGPEQRRPARAMLADGDARVRYQAAAALLRGGEPAAVPVLIALLSEAPTGLAWQAEDLLCRLVNEKLPLPAPAAWDEAGRRRYRDAWEAWWQDNGAKIDLKQVNLDDGLRGLTVIAELDGAGMGGAGRVWECGSDGKPRWSLEEAVRPIDVQMLPGGRVLVAEHGNGRVTERDLKGKVLWEHKVASQPVSCQRLAGGNTFIVTYNDLLEVTPAGKEVFKTHIDGAMIWNGQRLPNGHMVYVQSNSLVVELDARGKEVARVNVGNTGGWASVERLTNGHYLVALYSGRKVVEIDSNGKTFWECTVDSPGHATRLRNGNTLVASIEGRRVVEFDRSGKETWRQATQGRPFHVRRR